jgi:hypothetical protein
MSLLLATQEMQGAHVYVFGVVAVGAVGWLIFALTRRIRKDFAGRSRSDRVPETARGNEATGSRRGPEA